MDILYPGYWRRQNLHIGNVEYHVGDLIDGLHDKLTQQIARALRHEHDCMAPECRVPIDLEGAGPAEDRRAAASGCRTCALILEQDVQAAFEGDPAAKSYHEIIFCYPGLEAVTVYRIAHELLLLGVPLIPRMMTEYAHSQDRHRHPSRRAHRAGLLHRPRHRRGHRRDLRHRHATSSSTRA